MAGNILQLARKDAKNFVTAGGFEENINLQTPSGDLNVDVTGFATKHHINFDSDGLPINTKNVHICISESDLTALGYPVRNAKQEVDLLNHIIVFADSTGTYRTYKVNEQFPDEALGLINCILSVLTP